jgi:predicted TIM-barrel fold metal-dependent hydrolase
MIDPVQGKPAAEAVIDGCVFHEWPSTAALAPYLSEAWHELLIRPGDIAGPVVGKSQWLYQDPDGPKLASAYPEKGPPGSDRQLLCRQLLDSGERSRLVLGYDDGLLTTAFANHYVARTLVAAANDWTAVEWLDQDDRLYGLVLITNALPDEAAAEIRRSGRHSQMVGVAMGANALGRPFGHPIYHPIYAAAEDMGLPIVIQVGSETAGDLVTPPVSGGMPATFGEYRAMSMHGHMTHVATMIMQGVFELFPKLQVLLVGGGCAWIPGYLWRLDYFYKNDDQEVPWLRRLPSEYFVDHFRVSTYSLEEPADPSRLHQLLEAMPRFDELIVYTSGYPNSDSRSPAQIDRLLPRNWHDRVFRDNATRLFRWSDATPEPNRPAIERRSILEAEPIPRSGGGTTGR